MIDIAELLRVSKADSIAFRHYGRTYYIRFYKVSTPDSSSRIYQVGCTDEVMHNDLQGLQHELFRAAEFLGDGGWNMQAPGFVD